MRRIEGAPIIPPGALLHGHEMPGGVGVSGQQRRRRRRNGISEWMANFQFRAKKIDVISRVLFPSTFALFNIIYWSYYLTQENKRENDK